MGTCHPHDLNGENIFIQPLGSDFYTSDLKSQDISLHQNGYHHQPNTQWSCIAYSNFYSLVAVGSSSGMVIVLGKDVVHRFQIESGKAIIWLGFFRLELCAAIKGGRLVFWNIMNRSRVPTVNFAPLCEITSVCVIPNSDLRFIILGQLDGAVRFYDSLKKRPCSLTIPAIVAGLNPSQVVCAEFCPTQCNKLLIAYKTEPAIYLYNFVRRKIHLKYWIPSSCRSLALSKEYPIFVAGCEDGTICVFRHGERAAAKVIYLNNSFNSTPVSKIVIHDLMRTKNSYEISIYVSGGWRNWEDSGVVRLDLSCPLEGEPVEKSRATRTPISGRTTDFCLHKIPTAKWKELNYAEVIIQNVSRRRMKSEGSDVWLFATQYTHSESDDDEKKPNETRPCSLFHSELKDVADISLCSGANEELKDLYKFELATPRDLLGGELSSECECDYLVTGHESGVCILWKVAKREFFLQNFRNRCRTWFRGNWCKKESRCQNFSSSHVWENDYSGNGIGRCC